MTYQLLKGNSLDLLPTLAENSVDAIVTDPPYELGFMGKKWDASGIAYNVELWQQCLRVLKPGGHLLAFGGTRTYHRMTVAIEDAGFQIRDSIHWLYGSGFPKSLDVSKAIDKRKDDNRKEIYEVTGWIRQQRDKAGVSNKQIDNAFNMITMARHWTDVPPNGKQPAIPTLDQVPKLLEVLKIAPADIPERIATLLIELNGQKGQPGENWFKREIVGTKKTAIANPNEKPRHTIGASKAIEISITTPATDDAKLWEGWGTALKPAHEPIVLARKPLQGTVANNVLEHGTGALNIDGTRIGDEMRINQPAGLSTNQSNSMMDDYWKKGQPKIAIGRWPANVVISEQIAEQNPEWATYFYCPKPSKKERNAGLDGLPAKREADRTKDDGAGGDNPRNRSNTAKVNHHPTVKPLALMRYLIRLITPPDGTVLDPFAGSGTTMAAAIQENKNVIGIELTEDYWPIIEGRCEWAKQNPQQPTKPAQSTPTDYQPELPL